jgi:hypothetical protein
MTALAQEPPLAISGALQDDEPQPCRRRPVLAIMREDQYEAQRATVTV